MHLLALCHERVTGQGVGVLPADQHADSAEACFADPQTSAVTVRPRELLVERRHELSVMVEDRAVVPDEDVRVPEASDAHAAEFVEAQRDEDPRPARDGADAAQFGSGAVHGVRRQAAEPVVVVNRSRQRRPDGKGGHVGLREGNKLGAVPGRLLDETAGLLDRLLEIQEYRRHVSRRHLVRGIARHAAPSLGHTERRNRARTSRNRSGCSSIMKCPAPSKTTSCEPGIIACSRRLRPTGSW